MGLLSGYEAKIQLANLVLSFPHWVSPGPRDDKTSIVDTHSAGTWKEMQFTSSSSVALGFRALVRLIK